MTVPKWIFIIFGTFALSVLFYFVLNVILLSGNVFTGAVCLSVSYIGMEYHSQKKVQKQAIIDKENWRKEWESENKK